MTAVGGRWRHDWRVRLAALLVAVAFAMNGSMAFVVAAWGSNERWLPDTGCKATVDEVGG